MRREGYIIVTVEFLQEDGQWVGRCLELGTATCADTLDEVHEAMIEALELHLNALEETGERARFFRKHGIRIYSTPPERKETHVPFAEGTLFESLRLPVPVAG